jgi:hypothetical protein
MSAHITANEAGIPLPVSGRPASETLERCRALPVGESFACAVAGRALRSDMRALAHAYGKQSGKKFRTGQCPKDPAYYRIWRVQ